MTHCSLPSRSAARARNPAVPSPACARPHCLSLRGARAPRQSRRCGRTSSPRGGGAVWRPEGVIQTTSTSWTVTLEDNPPVPVVDLTGGLGTREVTVAGWPFGQGPMLPAPRSYPAALECRDGHVLSGSPAAVDDAAAAPMGRPCDLTPDFSPIMGPPRSAASPSTSRLGRATGTARACRAGHGHEHDDHDVGMDAVPRPRLGGHGGDGRRDVPPVRRPVRADVVGRDLTGRDAPRRPPADAARHGHRDAVAPRGVHRQPRPDAPRGLPMVRRDAASGRKRST